MQLFLGNGEWRKKLQERNSNVNLLLSWSFQYQLQVEGKILIRLDSGKDEENWQLTIGCNLPGKWVLHWGVNYENDIDRFML